VGASLDLCERVHATEMLLVGHTVDTVTDHICTTQIILQLSSDLGEIDLGTIVGSSRNEVSHESFSKFLDLT
jgi:hypothetical protein